MRVVSWNAGAFNKLNFSLPWFFNTLKKPEVICFQNTKLNTERFSRMKKNKVEFYHSFWSNLTTTEKEEKYSTMIEGGLGTYVTKQFKTLLSKDEKKAPKNIHNHNNKPLHIPLYNHELFSFPGKVLASDHGDFVLLNIHIPYAFNEPRKKQSKQRFQSLILDYCKKLIENDRNIILCGNFNTFPSELDCAYNLSELKLPMEKDFEWFEELNKIGMVDTFRKFYNDRSYTTLWKVNKGESMVTCAVRSSLIFANKKFSDKYVKDCSILRFQVGRDYKNKEGGVTKDRIVPKHLPVILYTNLPTSKEVTDTLPLDFVLPSSLEEYIQK